MRQYNGEKKKEKPIGKCETLHRMPGNAMVKRKRRNQRGKSETINRMTDNTMVKRKRRDQRGTLKLT